MYDLRIDRRGDREWLLVVWGTAQWEAPLPREYDDQFLLHLAQLLHGGHKARLARERGRGPEYANDW